jgi:hypothetical protein
MHIVDLLDRAYRRLKRASRKRPKTYQQIDADLTRGWERGKGKFALQWEQSNQGVVPPYKPIRPAE